MFLDIVSNLASMFWDIMKLPLTLFGVVLAVIFALFFANYLYLRFVKKMKKPVGEHYKVKEHNFFRKLFIDAPRRMAVDYLNRNPEFFRHQGMIIFTGRQGRGKTVALAKQSIDYMLEYPKCKVIGNMDFKYQDDVLDHWTQLIDYKNGIQGVVVQIDETQNWFSSNQSKDFPPQMLEVITQNRKNRRVILGTAQSFNRLAKPIREQTTEIRECHTFAGCVTVVIRKEPFLDSEGNVDKMKIRGWYWFVHTDEIRNAYDTYKVVESLRESGFSPAVGDVNVSNHLVLDKKVAKALRKAK